MFLLYIPFHLKANDLAICYSSPNLVETLIKEFVYLKARYFNPFQHSLYWKSVYSFFSVSLFCFKVVHANSTKNMKHQIKASQQRANSEELCNSYLFCRRRWSLNTNLCYCAAPQILSQGKSASRIRQNPWLQYWVTLQKVYCLLEGPSQVLRE